LGNSKGVSFVFKKSYCRKSSSFWDLWGPWPNWEQSVAKQAESSGRGNYSGLSLGSVLLAHLHKPLPGFRDCCCRILYRPDALQANSIKAWKDSTSGK